MLTLASRLAYTVAVSVAKNWSINALVRVLHAMAVALFRMCVAIFLEQMHEAGKLLENVSEEQIA